MASLPRRRAPLAALALVVASAAQAQETGTPVFAAPDRAFANYEIGFSLSSPEGADLGLEGFVGVGTGESDWGFRLGFVDRGRGTDLVIGARYRVLLVGQTPDFPLDGALTVGLGGSFDEGVSVLRVPIGLSVGRRFDAGTSGVSLMPYLHPVLVPTFTDEASELAVAVGLGLDLRLARRLDLRVCGSFGDLEGFAVSVTWAR